MLHFHFVHGFFGMPSDWAPTIINLKPLLVQPAQFHLYNLWDDLAKMPNATHMTWATQFGLKLAPKNNIIVGYSMGARLLAHLPAWHLDRIVGMALVGAHLGYDSAKEKGSRLERDEQWAQHFLHAPWEQLVADWNSQPIFSADRVRPKRKEEDFNRQLLARALRVWGVGTQDSLVGRLKDYRFPLYYIHGDKDEKFAEHALTHQKYLPNMQIKVVPGGHCPHFSDPNRVALTIVGLHNEVGLIK